MVLAIDYHVGATTPTRQHARASLIGLNLIGFKSKLQVQYCVVMYAVWSTTSDSTVHITFCMYVYCIE